MVIANTNTLIFIIAFFTLSAYGADEAVSQKKEQQEFLDVAKQNTVSSSPAQGKQVRRLRRTKVVNEVKKTSLVSEVGMNLGATAWGEKIQLLSADGRSENILVEYTGVALGLDYTLRGVSLGWNTAIKTLLLTGNAQAEGQSITYQNKVDLVTPLFLTTGLRFYPHDKVNVTLNIGATFYQLKLQAPTSVVTNYDFKYADNLQAIAQLQLAWKLSNNWLFQQEMFVSEKNENSVGWIVSLGYVF